LINYFNTTKINIIYIKAVIFIVICLVEIPGAISRIGIYRNNKINREKNNEVIIAGNWLKDNFTKEKKILYDGYSYIPAYFNNAYKTIGGSLELLKTINPDLIVTNQSVSKRFNNINDAEKYIQGKSEYIKKLNYYKKLKENNLNYKLIFDSVIIKTYIPLFQGYDFIIFPAVLKYLSRHLYIIAFKFIIAFIVDLISLNILS